MYIYIPVHVRILQRKLVLIFTALDLLPCSFLFTCTLYISKCILCTCNVFAFQVCLGFFPNPVIIQSLIETNLY